MLCLTTGDHFRYSGANTQTLVLATEYVSGKRWQYSSINITLTEENQQHTKVRAGDTTHCHPYTLKVRQNRDGRQIELSET